MDYRALCHEVDGARRPGLLLYAMRFLFMGSRWVGSWSGSLRVTN